jgi:hypothetical protein
LGDIGVTRNDDAVFHAKKLKQIKTSEANYFTNMELWE